MKVDRKQFWHRLGISMAIFVAFVILLGGVVLRAVFRYQREHPAEPTETVLESTIEVNLGKGEAKFVALVRRKGHDAVKKVSDEGQKILDAQVAVRGLFTDDEMTTVKPLLTRAEYREVVAKVEALSAGVAKTFDVSLSEVNQVLTGREQEAAEARRKAEEARRRAAELKAKQEQEIAAAWKVLNVPYHSQNLQKIYNGCETASLLMALQYKGYLKDVNLAKYAEMIPKSNDYNTGFVGSIYDLQPKTYVHWIAPAPLAKFGRESSGANVVDISGASLDDLDKEVAAGNPVIIYVTFLFNPLKEWLNGAPQNLHVVLLTGYNTVSGTQRLTDPWTQDDGGRTWDISKKELEQIYNAVGKRAVVVR